MLSDKQVREISKRNRNWEMLAKARDIAAGALDYPVAAFLKTLLDSTDIPDLLADHAELVQEVARLKEENARLKDEYDNLQSDINDFLESGDPTHLKNTNTQSC